MGACASSETELQKERREEREWEAYCDKQAFRLWKVVFDEIDNMQGRLIDLLVNELCEMLNRFEFTHKSYGQAKATYRFANQLYFRIKGYLEEKVLEICPHDYFREIVPEEFQSKFSYHIAARFEKIIKKYLTEKIGYIDVKTRKCHMISESCQVDWIWVDVLQTKTTRNTGITKDQILSDLKSLEFQR